MKSKTIRVLLALSLALSLASCGRTPPPTSSSSAPSSAPEPASSAETSSAAATPPLAGVNEKNYPKVDGSTATMPLMAELYAEICGVPRDVAETTVDVSTTGPSWQALLFDNADLLIVYEAAAEIQEIIEASDVKLEVTPLGRDGLVFLVNQKNTVDDLTQQQLRDIYTGTVTDWEGVGGAAGPIAPFQRDPTSGSQTMFLKLLMKDTKPMDAPSELVPAMMGALIDGVAAYDGSGGAIGYSVYYYAKEMYQNPDLKVLAVDGVTPSVETIGGGSYPLVNDFYVVIRENEPADSPARQMRDWLLTDAGRALVERAGYAPVG